MKALVALLFFIIESFTLCAQKEIYIPNFLKDKTDINGKQFSLNKTFQSENFILIWGATVGTDPAKYRVEDLRFNPKSVSDTLEYIYARYKQFGFLNDAKGTNLSKYKIVVIMSGTWGKDGINDFATGGDVDGMIGAIFVHPTATRDGGVLAHEFTHSLQNQCDIDTRLPNGLGIAFKHIVYIFCEAHANFMKSLLYPSTVDVGVDRNHVEIWNSWNKAYSDYPLLMSIMESDGIEMVNRLWRESFSDEYPLEAYKRLKGYTQSQFNDKLFDYAKRMATYDFHYNNVGEYFRKYRAESMLDLTYVQRFFNILSSSSNYSDHYRIPIEQSPEEYGYNLIPLYPSTKNGVVTILFKGHKEVNTHTGWRFGFVAEGADGLVSRYSPTYSELDSRPVSFSLTGTETKMYLVVMGAPKNNITTNPYNDTWAGYPKHFRFPYDLIIEGALPEGHQSPSDFRKQLKTSGKKHINGGGWVDNEASVSSKAYIGPYSIVLGKSIITENVTVDGTAIISDAILTDDAKVLENALVSGGEIHDKAVVRGSGYAANCQLSGSALVGMRARVENYKLFGSIEVGGDVVTYNTSGNCGEGVYYRLTNWFDDKPLECDGRTADHPENKDVNQPADAATAVTAIKSGDWSSPDTWDLGIPYSTDEIVVPAGITVSIKSPSVAWSATISGEVVIEGKNSSLSVKNLLTETLGTLTNNGTLLISRSFTNNGTYNSGNPSNLDFNGSGAMTVGGTFANPINNLVHSGNGDLTGNTSFTINGNYSNTGSGKGEFLTGTITFSGTGKTINGGLQGTTFNNMIITGSYEAAQKVNLSGVLDLSTAGTFDADGPSNTATFTIKSTSLTATGSIASLGSTPSRLSGNMTIERFYTPPSANGSWQYMSFPFSSTITVQDLQTAGFRVNGHFTSGAPLLNESMFTYIPNAANDVTGWLGIGWGGGATSAYQLRNNVGYVALAYPSNTPNSLISLTGAPAKGTINNIVITGGSGQYNLIPNPYPAPLNFVALQAANPGLLSTTVEVETQIASAGVGNSTTGSTASYTTAGVCTNCPAGWDGTKIAPGQSFWVTAAGTGNLTVTESMKSSSGTYVGRIAQETPKDYVRISLLSGNMKDESVILFREGAKETFNVINDAKKRLSGDPMDGTELRTYVNVGTLKPGTPEPLVFNFSPLLTPIANKNVKLYVQVVSAGAHSLKFTDLETFTLGYQFTLIDKFLNKQVEVKNGTEYAFTTTDVAASYALDRFELSIASEEVQTAANDEADKWVAYPNPSQGPFTINVPSSVTTNHIKILDSKGATVVAGLTKIENTIFIDLSNHSAGLYIVNVQEGNSSHVVKLIKKL